MNKAVIKIICALLSLICVLSLLAACSENKKPQDNKKNDFDLSAAASISGNRLQQAVEDQKKSSSAGGATKEPKKTPDKDETPPPYAIMGGSLKETPDPNATPGFHVLEDGGYREALTDSEYEKALAIAKNYASKNYPMNTGDFAPASDSDSLYGKNALYSKGNIIVITCKTPSGTMHSIAVARANAQAKFKVVDAK